MCPAISEMTQHVKAKLMACEVMETKSAKWNDGQIHWAQHKQDKQ